MKEYAKTLYLHGARLIHRTAMTQYVKRNYEGNKKYKGWKGLKSEEKANNTIDRIAAHTLNFNKTNNAFQHPYLINNYTLKNLNIICHHSNPMFLPMIC